MEAIQFNLTIPRYALGLALGKITPKFYWSGISCTGYKDIPLPELLTDDWVMVKTRLGGVCGSDISALSLSVSRYYSALASYPFVLGHENIGRIHQIGGSVERWSVGDRVVVEPALWCKPRGFEDLCEFCEKGEINRCLRITEGNVSPGIQTGLCHDTGGSWSPFFLAHKEQIYKVSENISDENALMIEPFAIGLHAVLQNFPGDRDKVLIIGAGSIGLCTLAALRSLGSEADIAVIGKYPYQAEAAKRLGATTVVLGSEKDVYRELIGVNGAKLIKPILGKQLIIGGFDITFDCVGSSHTLDDAMRLTTNGGTVILPGEPSVVHNLDWTSIFTQELSFKAAYLYNHVEKYDGKEWRAFDLAIKLMEEGKVDLGWMITHKFRLRDYSRAFELAFNRGKSQAIKIAFEFDD